MFCEGGLGACTVCWGLEGALPTDCPGVEMDQATQDRVYVGEIDYREGRGWVVPDGTGRSMGDQRIEIERIRASKEER